MREPHSSSRACFIILALGLFLAGCEPSGSRSFSDGMLVMFGGDTHFGENYVTDNSPNDQLRYITSMAALKPFAQRSAFAVVNLEAPLSLQLPDALTGKAWVHWTDPAKAGPALLAAGIDAVSLANNHSLDQGAAGLRITLRELNNHGIASFGADKNLARAQAPLLRPLDRPGGGRLMLAVFGMLEQRPLYRDKHNFYAGPDRAGVAPLDVAVFRDQVKELRQSHNDLYVVAFPHWGENYRWAQDTQRALRRALIDAGADMVIGQHAHTLQEVERYNGKWILYGIGNFDFLAPGRYRRYEKILPYSLIVQLSFGEDSAQAPMVRLYPIQSDNRKTGYRPRPASRKQAEMVLKRLAARRLSTGFDARLVSDRLGPAIALAN